MIQLGIRQRLIIVKMVEFGAYLSYEEHTEERILLPIRQLPEGTQIGDELEVFVYKDSKDRLIATTRQPKLQLGGLAVLRVAEVGKIGAFLDWGLEKELLLPFAEQTRRVREGDECLVSLYVDKSGRLCATMKVYEYLQKDSSYEKDDKVTARVYDKSAVFGMFAAVDDKYSALIPARECPADLDIGDVITARVTKVHEDGKLDISVREKAYIQMEEDSKLVLKVLDEYEGVLPFTDKASPEIIKREFGLSKNAFKRAVGKLLKEGYVKITEHNIIKIKQEEQQ